MATAAQIQTKITKAMTNMDRLDAFVNGDEEEIVALDDGSVPSITKYLADKDDEIAAILAGATEAAASASASAATATAEAQVAAEAAEALEVALVSPWTAEWDFAEGVYRNVSLRCLRSTVAMAKNQFDEWMEYPAKAPRVNGRGLTVEPGTTNVLSDSPFASAVAGTVGSGGALPQDWLGQVGGGGAPFTSIVVSGLTDEDPEDGLPYGTFALSYDNSANGSPVYATLYFNSPGDAAYVPGDTWTHAVWIDLVSGGNASESISVQFFDGSSYVDGAYTLLAINEGRVEATKAVATVGTDAVLAALNITIAANQNYAATFRIGLPQLSKDLRGSSPIKTDGPIARAADTVRGRLDPIKTAVVGPFSVQSYPEGASEAVLWQSGSDGNNYVRFSYIPPTQKIRFRVVVGGAQQCDLDLGTITLDAEHTVGAAWRTNEFVASMDGGTAVTDTSGSVPASLTHAYFGADHDGAKPISATIAAVRCSADFFEPESD